MAAIASAIDPAARVVGAGSGDGRTVAPSHGQNTTLAGTASPHSPRRLDALCATVTPPAPCRLVSETPFLIASGGRAPRASG